ncbi:pilin [Candidatus Pacebacteria bacterium]|nr:pilin [Candidatus Paceibacterota bacterium]
MKSFFGILVVAFIVGLVPDVVSAAGGLVTCDGPDCNLCTFVSMINKVKNFIISILVIASVILLAVTGVQMAINGGNGDALKILKDRLTNIIIGFLLVIAAWVIVDTILKTLVTDQKILNWSTLTTSAPDLCFKQLEPISTKKASLKTQ